MIVGSEGLTPGGGGWCSSVIESLPFTPEEEFGLSTDDLKHVIELFVDLSNKNDKATYLRLYQEWEKLQAQGVKMEKTERLIAYELAKAGISSVSYEPTLESLIALLNTFLETDHVLREIQFKLHEFLQRISYGFESIKVFVRALEKVNKGEDLTKEEEIAVEGRSKKSDLGGLISEINLFLEENDVLLQAEVLDKQAFLNKSEESLAYLQCVHEKISGSDLNENFITELEGDLVKFLLKRNQSLCEEVRRTCSTQPRIKYEMKDSERFNLGLWLAEDIADVKVKYRGSYGMVPWEEAEFLLVGHLATMKRLDPEISPYSLFLYPQRISSHLSHFRDHLVELYEEIKLKLRQGYPRKARDKTIEDILKEYPQFESLYRDYKVLRDIYSLQRSISYLSAIDNISDNGYSHLALEKAMQVMGECLKNTHMSPNMSEDALKMTVMFTNMVIKKCVIGLRDFLSHEEHTLQASHFQEVSTCLSTIRFLFSHSLHLKLVQAFKYFAQDIKHNSTDFLQLKNIISKVQCHQFIRLLKEYDVMELYKILSNYYDDADIKKLYEDKEDIINIVDNIIKAIIDFVCFIKEICDMKVDAISTLRDRVNLMVGNLNLILVKYIQDLGINAYFNLTCIKNSKNDRIKLKKIEYQLKDNQPPENHNEQETLKTNLNAVLGESKSSDKEIAETLKVETLTKDILQKELERMPNTTTERKMLEKHLLENIDSTFYQFHFQSYNMYHEYKNIRDDFIKSPAKSSIAEMLILKIMESENSPDGNLQRVGAYSKFLHGKQLRNYLAHGNRMELIDTKQHYCILAHAALEIKNKNKSYEAVNVEFNRRNYLQVVTENERMLQAVLEGDMPKLKEMVPQLKKSTWLSIKGRDFNDKGVWHMLIKRNDVAFMEQVRENFHLDFPPEIDSLIFFAVIYGSDKILKHLFEDKELQLTQKKKDDALFEAINRGLHRIVQTMLNIGADPNKIDDIVSTPLIRASFGGHTDIVKELLRSDRFVAENVNHVDKNRMSALHMAAVRGHHDIILELIKNKATVDLPGLHRRTPLHNASQNGFLKAVEVLIGVGKAGVNLKMDNGCTALHLAAEEGHKPVVEFLLKFLNLAEVNLQDQKGNTALHYACEKGHYEVAIVLIKEKAEMDLRNKNEDTVLHLAVLSGNVKLVKDLLSRNDSLKDSTNLMGNTPLHVAAKKGQEDIVEALIKSLINIEAQDKYGYRPLHLAVEKGHLKTVEILLYNNSDINAVTSDKGLTPLIIASENGHKDVVNLLLKKGAQDNKEAKFGGLAIHAAANNGHHDIVEMILTMSTKTGLENETNSKNKVKGKKNNKNRNKVSAKENNVIEKEQKEEKGNEEIAAESLEVTSETPLMVAVHHGHLQTCNELLKKGNNPNVQLIDGFAAIHIAAQQGNTDLVELLIKFKAYVNLKTKDGMTPFFLAVQEGHTNTAKVLLEKDFKSLNMPRHDGTYPIHITANNGHLETLKLLIEKGEEFGCRIVDCKSENKGFTPLFLACSKQNINMVQYLLDQKADPNITNYDNVAPIHTAVACNNAGMLKLLLSKGALANITCKDNITPLYLTCFNNFTEIAKILLEVDPSGINIAATEPLEPTPLLLAVKWGNIELVQLLIKKGAEIDDETLGVALSLENESIISLITEARVDN